MYISCKSAGTHYLCKDMNLYQQIHFNSKNILNMRAPQLLLYYCIVKYTTFDFNSEVKLQLALVLLERNYRQCRLEKCLECDIQSNIFFMYLFSSWH